MMLIVFDDYTYELGAKTVVAAVCAMLLGLLGFLLSMFALAVVWLIPAMRARSPPYHSPKRRVSPHHHRIRLMSPEPTVPPVVSHTPSLRRPASFPELHQSPSSIALARPTTARHVSFNLEHPGCCRSGRPPVPNTTTPPAPLIQRRWPSAVSPFAKRKLARQDSSPRSQISSDGSGTLVPSAPCSPKKMTPGVHDLPLRCFDDQCDCHARGRSSSADEMGHVKGAEGSSPPASTSMRSSLSMSIRLPQVRKAFSTKRRISSADSATLINPVEAEGSARGCPKATVPSNPKAPYPALPSSGEMYQTGFVNPLKIKRVKSSAISPKLDEPPKANWKSGVIFSNPWSTSSSSRDAPHSHAQSSSLFGTSLPKPTATRKSIASRFVPLRFRSGVTESPLPSTSATTASRSPSPKTAPMILSRSKGKSSSKPVERTHPYGPPYNLPMPGQHGRELPASDPEFYARKAVKHRMRKDGQVAPAPSETVLDSHRPSKPSRGRKPNGGSRGRYPPENLLSELDHRLSAIQKAQQMECAENIRNTVAASSPVVFAEGETGGGMLWTLTGLRDAVEQTPSLVDRGRSCIPESRALG
ncbi:hypothetical protein BV22DRAFT_1130259 [Leucogyrophana mollusca]|uniref:Uncharacterized protein n=1 Tax=Leucogyrophana mollusca TaxID=85980 RepID=A0ACB8BGE8_9AGAM|nr:hypothetical protein BV22DRAFT_1130259 [Leucogyrophana mollusca]